MVQTRMVQIDHHLAPVLKIDRDLVVDDRLHLPTAPVDPLWVNHQIAGLKYLRHLQSSPVQP
jgi:hypothetical protein